MCLPFQTTAASHLKHNQQFSNTTERLLKLKISFGQLENLRCFDIFRLANNLLTGARIETVHGVHAYREYYSGIKFCVKSLSVHNCIPRVRSYFGKFQVNRFRLKDLGSEKLQWLAWRCRSFFYMLPFFTQKYDFLRKIYSITFIWYRTSTWFS